LKLVLTQSLYIQANGVAIAALVMGISTEKRVKKQLKLKSEYGMICNAPKMKLMQYVLENIFVIK